MLKRWSIENFKSFSGRTDLALAPITIFAGANSSGKSSIIQSILLLKQTVQYAPASRGMALNGPLVKLGTFEDIKNSKSDDNYIGIAWEMDVEDSSQRFRSSNDLYSEQFYYMGRSNLSTVSGDFRWDAVPSTGVVGPTIKLASADLLQLNPRITSASLLATTNEKGAAPFMLTMERQKDSKLSVTVIDDFSQAEVVGNKPDCSIVGGTLRYFFPSAVAVRFNSTLNRAREIAQMISGDDPYTYYRARDIGRVELSPSVVNEIFVLLTGESRSANLTLFPEVDEATTVEEVAARYRRYRMNNRAHRKEPTRTPNEIRSEIEAVLYRGQSPQYKDELEFPSLLNEGSQYATQYFMSAVHYLGPLRDEPKPIYPLEALASTTEVGFKGEHTAAVLDLHKDRSVRYLPSSFITGDGFNLNSKYVSLHDAVVDWLTYVGVASEVSTEDQGKVGHQLQVRTQGIDRFHDLTNVGVGVSQVLPIIVSALLADSPALLIFEQPELHLHPKVQARLADFFLSVALIGKQCILETHSEYLIDRFRHRVAAAVGDSLVATTKIYFTEREAGTTKCREVPVTKYGAISDWPKDFFEQSQLESEAILRAAAAKRQAEKNARNK
ncbi:DUF3696 domain-containing protein [Tardiphaga alba]|uniref:DUF3696 domain-containing protein n=1 Tax=Tardiphaga alba TaxID=340268 RepID=A0ABX8A4S7_9BRAD|nr:DUF3696 domain-containing protein [Tardiphaga alba]QUS38638.1 DUF3696 domain-containing protein [Tardiphaga alba]